MPPKAKHAAPVMNFQVESDSRRPDVMIPTATKMIPAMIIAAARKKVTDRKLLPSWPLLPLKKDPDGACAETDTTPSAIMRTKRHNAVQRLHSQPKHNEPAPDSRRARTIQDRCIDRFNQVIHFSLLLPTIILLDLISAPSISEGGLADFRPPSCQLPCHARWSIDCTR